LAFPWAFAQAYYPGLVSFEPGARRLDFDWVKDDLRRGYDLPAMAVLRTGAGPDVFPAGVDYSG